MFDLQKYQLRARTNLHNLFVSIRSGFMIVSKKPSMLFSVLFLAAFAALWGFSITYSPTWNFLLPFTIFPLCSLL